MNKTTQVENFVEEIFDLYHFSKSGFFFDLDEDTGEEYETPLFPNGEIDNDTLARLSVKLGLTSDEILCLDEAAMYKYWNKYPFFKLYDSFLDAWTWNSRYKEKNCTKERLFEVLFSEKEISHIAEERYDYLSVKKRMLQQLKEMDAYMPGAFHPNAAVTNLTIETETLFSFPEITEMLRSYIAMVKKTEEYFFKAINEQLAMEEINEYNFLVNALQVTDGVMPSVLVTYDNVCAYRKAYIEEGFDDFFAYVKVRSFVGTGILQPGINPWRCKEFFDDMDLVQELAYIFPAMKELMRRFAMRVKNFQCCFVWSDAQPITYSEEDEQEWLEAGMYIHGEERAKECTVVYVSKTKEELYDWDSYIDKMNQVIVPPAKGGLKIKPYNIHTIPPYDIERIRRRFELRQGGNV